MFEFNKVLKNVVLIVVSKHLLNYFHTHVTKIVVGTVVQTMIVGTAVPTRVVETAAKEIFVPAIIVGTVVPIEIVGTPVPTIIVLTAYYWKSCSKELDLQATNSGVCWT